MIDQVKETSNAENPKKRLLLDVTIAATTDLNTGIQRVVRRITRESENVAKELTIECVPVVCQGSHLTAVGFDGSTRIDERMFQFAVKFWVALHQKIASFLCRIRQGLGTSYLKFLSRLRKILIPKTAVRWLSTTYRKWTRQSVQFRKGDILVLLDASWDLPLEEILQSAKLKGVKVATVVYDLIPVRHPGFHEEPLRVVFKNWLDLVIAQADFMIGISKTVRDDLLEYATEHCSSNADPDRFDSFRLGADFDSCHPANSDRDGQFGQRLQSVVGDLSGTRFYLSVGTIEPRKNHSFLLDAFEEVWKKRDDVILVIAGKVGWMCDAVADRIRNHPRINRSLFFFEDATDNELRFLYQNAKSLVFPSIVEGFGLPIVEAFYHGLPVLASDTKIHREVGGELAEYFGLEDPGLLAHLIENLESEKMELKIPRVEITNWNTSCREFLSKIVENMRCPSASKETNQTDSRAA
ncbi:MAG: glycosyltransferase family 1 protein [Planctomycetota bacterium]|nr:glycosyltransferase family 1 protein [Planctomycetota bacterium]